MKTTVEIPDNLFRHAKAVAALRGRKLKDLVEEGLRHVLESPEVNNDTASQQVTLHDLMKDYCGVIDSGVTDLATSAEHMKYFGNAPQSHR